MTLKTTSSEELRHTIKVTAIQRGCVFDGPGVRTTVFLYGCSLRCPWCCNPETWAPQRTVLDHNKCLRHLGISSGLCKDCSGLQGKSRSEHCHLGAITRLFESYSPRQLYDRIAVDFALLRSSGGGVTFSGGEPLLQSANLIPLLRDLKNDSIDICFETSLVAPIEDVKRILPFTSRLIVDLKLQPEMFINDAEYLASISDRLEFIPPDIPKYFRIVYIDSLQGLDKRLASVLQKLKITEIELLKAHNLAQNKYSKFNLPFTDYSASEDGFEAFAHALSETGINVNTLSI